MTVELHSAFVWDCDECGKENFERAIEGGMDEAALMADENRVTTHLVGTGEVEIEDSEDDDLMACESLTQMIVLAPATVTCKHCGVTTATEVPHQHDDADE